MNENDNIKELIQKAVKGANDCLSLQQRGELAKSKIDNLLKAKGYKSIKSRKAQEFFLNKAFAFELKNGDIFAYKMDSLHETSKGVDVYTSNCLLFSIKTKGGTIYATKKANGNFICWTAHFFDRYSERSGLKLKRKDAIKYYFRNYLLNGSIVDDGRIESGLFRTFSNEGADLGEVYDLTGERYNGDSMKLAQQPVLVFFKTFVSKDMFSKEQNRTLEKNIKEVIESLDADDQDVFSQEKKFVRRNHLQKIGK